MTKVLIIVLAVVALLTQTVYANEISSEQWEQITHQDKIDAQMAADDYQWLYEKLMPENLRRDNPNETFKSFRVHLKDTFNNFPDPDLILKKNLNTFAQATEMTGSITENFRIVVACAQLTS